MACPHSPPFSSPAPVSPPRRWLQVLQSLAPAAREILAGAPLRVQLRGLEYMNDDPSQASGTFVLRG